MLILFPTHKTLSLFCLTYPNLTHPSMCCRKRHGLEDRRLENIAAALLTLGKSLQYVNLDFFICRTEMLIIPWSEGWGFRVQPICTPKKCLLNFRKLWSNPRIINLPSFWIFVLVSLSTSYNWTIRYTFSFIRGSTFFTSPAGGSVLCRTAHRAVVCQVSLPFPCPGTAVYREDLQWILFYVTNFRRVY